MKKGEEVSVKSDYDLFGHNAKGYTGVYVSTDKLTKKCLIYFPELEEWGEILRKNLKRTAAGVVSEENRDFISRVRKLEYTL